MLRAILTTAAAPGLLAPVASAGTVGHWTRVSRNGVLTVVVTSLARSVTLRRAGYTDAVLQLE